MSKKLVILLACLAAAVLVAMAFAEPKSLAVGTDAPQFVLKSQDGNPVSLADFRGKWVVLYFYPKDFTSGCTLEAHNFQRDLAEYAKRNAVILGVSVDDVKSHAGFCSKEGLNFKLLADTEGSAAKLYGSYSSLPFAHADRHTFLIAPDGKIAAVWQDVKPNEHSAEVLAKLSALQK